MLEKLLIAVLIFGHVLALAVENQLEVIKSDCFEKLAAGERLDPKDVYGRNGTRTLADCQKLCTDDEEKCKSFSFAIEPKNNGTCELSSHAIKETADLKPIGTVADTNYDLYIKKLGCKLVMQKRPEVFDESSKYEVTEQPHLHPSPRPGLHHVQTLVSVSSGNLYGNNKTHKDGPNYVQHFGYDRPSTFDIPRPISTKPNNHNSHSGPSFRPSSSNYDIFDFTRPNSYGNQRPIIYEEFHGNRKPGNNYDQIDGFYGESHGNRRPGNNHDQINGFYGQGHGNRKPGNNYDQTDVFYEEGHGNRRPGNNHDQIDGFYGEGHGNRRPGSNHDYINGLYGEFQGNNHDENHAFYGESHGNRRPANNYDQSGSFYGDFHANRRPGNNPDGSYGEAHSNQRPAVGDSLHGNNRRPENNYYGYRRPSYEPYGNKNPGQIGGLYGGNGNKIPAVYSPKFPHQKPIVSENLGPNGQLIMSIITPIDDVCFRRALAGKRVTRAFVRRSLSCESIEDCQRECADEKRFVCEGFNYRLDPSRRGRGDCELLEVPYVRLDLIRDVFHDPECDYYMKDRDGYPDCKSHRPPYRPYGGGSYPPGNAVARPPYGSSRPPPSHIVPPYSGSRPPSYDGGGHRPRPAPSPIGYYGTTYNRRYDFRQSYHSQDEDNRYSFHSHHYPGISYIADSPDYKPPYDYKSYEPYLYHYHVDRDRDRQRDRNNWGFSNFDRGWGTYGGVYGNFGKGDGYYGYQRYDDHNRKNLDWGGVSYYDYWNFNSRRNDGYIGYGKNAGVQPLPPTTTNLLVPPNFGYSYANDECSLRSVAGFRLYHGVVKKIFSVPSVYECELLCFKEVDFVCNSYAYKYTSIVDNCYLSNRNYKELDYYTDLEQDRDCDVYTMHNRKRCGQPFILERDDCFLLARSGQRLDQRCVKDSLTVGSIVECQIECLKSIRFICRSFSYRYGPSPLAGIIDNCQLSDLPYHELNPRTDLITEPGFVLYERRSFGRGCELVHFPIPGSVKPPPNLQPLDELCYIGYAFPAILLPEATRKPLRVASEAECRRECSRCREETIFHCMSFSYRSSARQGKPNCFLSDIYHRDLTEKIDYIRDPNSWLFAWDHYNPKCYPLSFNEYPDYNNIGRHRGYNSTDFLYDNVYGLDTWKMYSVGGWPCKRGTCCRQDREIGFWFCELEGGSPSAWDYCCRPDHHCGYSRGYPYQWCFVGSSSTQWRKCNDRYYPYSIDRDYRPYLPQFPLSSKPYLPENHLYPPLSDPYPPQNGYHESRPWITRPDTPTIINTLEPPYRPSFRPDRPLAAPTLPPPKPSLDQYEMQFDQQFLDPPKPGGFGQPRYWPVSYLHKEKPPNVNTTTTERMEAEMPKLEEPKTAKLEAIQNLIDVIKSNDLKDIRYHITNDSDKADDILFVQIPLPTNFSADEKKGKNTSDEVLSQPVDLLPPKEPKGLRLDANDTTKIEDKPVPYRKGYVTKTKVANYGRKNVSEDDEDFSLF